MHSSKNTTVRKLIGEKILIGPSSFASIDRSPMDRLIEVGCEIVDNPFRRKLTKSELMDRDVLEKSNLKVISRCGSGLSNVDLIAAQELGIKVFSTPNAPVGAVAELTLGAMLSLLRMIQEMNADLHEGKWAKRVGLQLEGKTVVIIGFGRIGRRVASLLAAFQTKILAVDPYLSGPDSVVPVVPLEKALPQADIVTIHCSGEGCLVGERELSLMKCGALLLNAARGGSVDENALIQAIDQGRIAGAWIDTFEQEPYAGPLTRYPQVILTPHVGSYTLECRRQMENEAVENLISALTETKKQV
jgi:D-3-phosphoglycerate dehydrogenase